MSGENWRLVADEPVEFEKYNQLRSKTLGNLPIIFKEFTEYISIYQEKPKDFNMKLVGLGKFRILTSYAQILPRTLSGTVPRKFLGI